MQQLEITTAAGGTASANYLNEGDPPWFTLGLSLAGATEAKEAAALAGMDWTVSKAPLYLVPPEADENINTFLRKVPGVWATVRDDKADGRNVLGIVRSRYAPIQNRDLFQIADQVLGQMEGSAYHVGGMFQNGRRVWLMLRLHPFIRVGDEYAGLYILITTTHDASEAGRVIFVPVHDRTQSTLNVLHRHSALRIHHMGELAWEATGAEIAAAATAAFTETAEAFGKMGAVRVTPDSRADYFRRVIPDSTDTKTAVRTTNIRAIFEHLNTGYTVWSAYTAVAEFIDHVRLNRSSRDRRLISSWFGSGRDLRDRALKHALALI